LRLLRKGMAVMSLRMSVLVVRQMSRRSVHVGGETGFYTS